MQEDRDLIPAEDGRSRAMIAAELRRALVRMGIGRRPPGITRSNIVNGFRDADGNFQEWWRPGDIVGSKLIRTR